MEILNPKVGTVPRKFEKFFLYKSPRARFSVLKIRVCFGRRFKTMIKIIEKKIVGAENFLEIML